MAFILLKVHFLKIISRDPRTKSGPGRTAIKKDENLRPGPDNFENYELDWCKTKQLEILVPIWVSRSVDESLTMRFLSDKILFSGIFRKTIYA